MAALTAKFKKMRNEAGKATGETFFPSATEADAKYLDHLNMKIDLHDHSPDSVTIETAAKDEHGSAIYKKSWSNSKVETVQKITVTEEKAVPTVQVNVAEAVKAKIEEAVAPQQAPATVVPTATTTIIAKTTASPTSEVSAKRQAELDEARDVAF